MVVLQVQAFDAAVYVLERDRQLPETDTLHSPRRSPDSRCTRQPLGAPADEVVRVFRQEPRSARQHEDGDELARSRLVFAQSRLA